MSGLEQECIPARARRITRRSVAERDWLSMCRAYAMRSEQSWRHARHFALGARMMLGARLPMMAALMLACAAASALESWLVQVASLAAGKRASVTNAPRPTSNVRAVSTLHAPADVTAAEHVDGVGLVICIDARQAARLVSGGNA